MKKTIKQWCIEYGINWLGQGKLSHIQYDWKIVLSKGTTAIFSSSVKGMIPEVIKINEKNILLFPNVNSSHRSGKISRSAFLNIIDWVNECLSGNIREYKSQNQGMDLTGKTQFDPVKV